MVGRCRVCVRMGEIERESVCVYKEMCLFNLLIMPLLQWPLPLLFLIAALTFKLTKVSGYKS